MRVPLRGQEVGDIYPNQKNTNRTEEFKNKKIKKIKKQKTRKKGWKAKKILKQKFSHKYLQYYSPSSTVHNPPPTQPESDPNSDK